MAEQLGKMEKPEAQQFAGKRKLFLVPLIFSGQNAPPEYTEKFNLYWEQVVQHVANLELKVGKVNHVYHELITLIGEDGLKMMEKLSPSSYQIVRNKCQSSAVLEATEDKGLVDESMDWERSILMGFISQKVANVVYEFYLEALKNRYEHIAKRIAETLKDNEVGMLIVREGHMVQFPPDIEVFSVVPPVLDEIHRWQRARKPADEGDKT